VADPATSALSASLAGWRANYWDRPLVREACVAMAAKYAALASLEALAPGKAQDVALRAAAGRWPGCLRESQLAGPARCQERHAQASAGLSGAERRRASWRDEGAAALVLWADLHPLLGDLLAWRRASSGQGGLAGLVAFAAAGPAARRWPADPALLAAVAGTRVRVRMAYAWLAAQADLGLPALNLHLFGRTGPWDTRTGDPSEIS
jgi:hypothetical protein